MRHRHLPLESDDAIRLLRLEGSSRADSEVRGEIIHASLRDPPSYEAISYTWQGQTPDSIVFIASAFLDVTRNCHAALRHFRPNNENDARLLWIDTICIDQDGVYKAEKSHQITLMGRIFSSARQVLVWLQPYPIEAGPHERNNRVARWLSKLATASTWDREHRQTEVNTLIHDANLQGVSQRHVMIKYGY